MISRTGTVTDTTGRELGRIYKVEQNYQVNTGTHARTGGGLRQRPPAARLSSH